MSLQLARTPVSARHQMHLDLYSDDQSVQSIGLSNSGLGSCATRSNPTTTTS